MKPRLLLLAPIAAAAPAVAASGQGVRPESLSYMSRVFTLKDFGIPDNPRYSRDGKWLAFDAPKTGATGRHIFVVAPEGGTPIAITTGTHTEVRPLWTAAGDRLAFYSSEGNGTVMTIAIDPSTGRATGSTRRVTIDSLRPTAFDVAPDGRSVAYLTPTGPNKYELRIVPISGGPARTITSIDADASPGAVWSAGNVHFDRAGAHVYFAISRPGKSPKSGTRARELKRIATSGGDPETVLTIPEGLMGMQIDPVADRILVRDGDRAHVLTLGGDSVATISWPLFVRTVANLGFAIDGSSLVTAIDARHYAIHVVPLDGGPTRALTDGSGYPWPDYWLRDHIFVSDVDRGVETLMSPDGTKRTITIDLSKARDGGPVKVVEHDPFPDGAHFIVKAVSPAGDTSLFVFDSRTGDARRVMENHVGSRLFAVAGPGDDYLPALGDDILYRNVRNGVVDVHALDDSGRDRVVQSFPLPKQPETVAFAPGRMAHSYLRGDTVYLDVTIGSGKPVHALVRPGARMGEIVFNRDGSSLYADVITGKNPNAHTRGVFLSTADAQSLALPIRWVETGNCWHPTWLPNGTGVLEFCTNETSTKTWVSRVPASGPATPQPLTQRETSIFWDYTMSPDGKYVAVPAEKNAGVNLWRIDLRAAAKARRGP